MKRTIIFILPIIILFTSTLTAQQQEQKQKSPTEMAAEQSEKLQKELKLSNKQLFLVDSVLQSNISGVFNEFEKLKAGGRQTSNSYKDVREKWDLKTENAFKLILNPEQLESYLKLIGKLDRKGRPKKQPKSYR